LEWRGEGFACDACEYDCCTCGGAYCANMGGSAANPDDAEKEDEWVDDEEDEEAV
jgi:hypothetical protein